MSATIELTLRDVAGIAAPATEERLTRRERLAYLRRFGTHSMSSALMAPDMRYFDVPGAGFVGYMQSWGRAIALADPVAAPANRETVLDAFLERHPQATFVQVSAPVAALLRERHGLYATQLGVETMLDVESWTPRGRKKQALRTAVNQAEAQGITVSEGLAEDERAQLSHEWLATRRVAGEEMAFLVRPADMAPMPETRVFTARERAHGRAIGYVAFDPIFENRRVVGYVPNVSRASVDFRQGIFYALVLHAVERFREEGVRVVNLGLSPLALDETPRAGESLAFRRVIATLFRHGNRLYNFQGIRFAKSRFRGREEPVFIAHRPRVPVRAALATLSLSGVI